VSNRAGPLEIVLSAAWHSGAIPLEAATVDGIPIQIIHRGTWSHGLGPDFRDALILFDGRELRAGSVEIHLQTRGWFDHGHHLDAAYDSVVLHVVARHDGAITHRLDGATVPVLEVGPIDESALPDFATWNWDQVGGQVCASQLMASEPKTVRAILNHLGDTRLAARSARIEARLAAEPPGEILWSELLDGLGFSSNRAPMREIARRVPLASIESLILATKPPNRLAIARGILLGASGFLPLSQQEAHLAGLDSEWVSELERAWQERGAPWHMDSLTSADWNRARIRPANHPAVRLVAAANMVNAGSQRGGLLQAILELLAGNENQVVGLQALATSHGVSYLGGDRALDMVASSIIPFALALADHSGDPTLGEAAGRYWEQLPAPAKNAITRRAMSQVAGRATLGQIGARGAQGLIHLDTTLCQPRRCFECPIARAELAVNA
jgi:hypothetical protein